MQPTALMAALFSAGLPAGGYTFIRHSIPQRDAMLRQISADGKPMDTANPVLAMVAVDSQQTIFLITRPGHFAHPSIIRRSLVVSDGTRTVQIDGYTAAAGEIMATWLSQFREQDKLTRRALVG